MRYSRFLHENELAIFLFHGVIETQRHSVRNYTRKHLLVHEFAKVLNDLVSNGCPVSMDEVVSSRGGGKQLPPNSFAVTFDDGFENNLSVAAPVLADLGIPATFYVTTTFVEENRMSWVDRIEYAFEATPAAVVELPWGVREFRSVADKRNLLDEIRRSAKSDAAIDAELLADDLQRQIGVPRTTASDDPLDRKLTWRQVRQLNSHKLFSIGGHCHHHVNMARLTADLLDYEIVTCLRLLGEKVGITATHFAYPEGLAHCFSDRVIERLKHYGITCCPTAIEGTNNESVDLFHLYRIPVV